ncbi:MAG: hypothetical protein QOD78_279 [Chloroflexota bacterium]|nr:hypothetical protein [Chloroflexota bacterium]
MTANDSLERRITDHYAAEAPPRAPDWVLGSTLDAIDATPQRRVLIRVPRRFPNMNNFAKVAIAAVVVIAVGAVGLSVLRPPTSSGLGGQPGASPSASASTPGTSPGDSRKSPPALTGTYTSARYGFTIAYPAGWVTRPATDTWTTGVPDFGSTTGDVIYDPALQDHLWIMVASQPLADGKTATQWVADLLSGLGGGGLCDGTPVPVTIDGNDGRQCGSPAAAVAAGGRGYAIVLYVSLDDPSVAAAYDQAYFDEILATLKLQPQNAVDSVPSASP